MKLKDKIKIAIEELKLKTIKELAEAINYNYGALRKSMYIEQKNPTTFDKHLLLYLISIEKTDIAKKIYAEEFKQLVPSQKRCFDCRHCKVNEKDDTLKCSIWGRAKIDENTTCQEVIIDRRLTGCSLWQEDKELYSTLLQ